MKALALAAILAVAFGWLGLSGLKMAENPRPMVRRNSKGNRHDFLTSLISKTCNAMRSLPLIRHNLCNRLPKRNRARLRRSCTESKAQDGLQSVAHSGSGFSWQSSGDL
jgi:hypothetical protein